MAVLRKEKREHYTVIDNAIFCNYDLSLKAKGLLCQMLSLPDGWEFSVEGLSKLSTDGKSAITSALNELEEAGYFYREQARVNGKMAGAVYVISEVPFAEKPIAENPTSENPMTENPPQYNTNKSNTNKSNTNRYRFKPPTVEEVSAYITEHGYHINAEQFVDYYESNGWRVGRSPMKDYKACIRNWERRRRNDERPSAQTNPFMAMLENGEY